MLQHAAVCCSVFAVCCDLKGEQVDDCSVLQHVAECCSMLQCVAACCDAMGE